MTKSILISGLLAFLSTAAFAEPASNAAISNNGKAAANPIQVVADNTTATTPDTGTTVTAPGNTKTPAADTTTVAPENNTAPASNVTPAPDTTPITTQPIDCNFKIPAETTKVDETVVLQWAEKAAQQSFTFNYATIDQQLTTLKACYTEQGWQSFNDALQKSGNMNTIKIQQLNVTSTIDGKPTVAPVKDNQWKANIPLQVVYQSEKDKISQQLTVDLIVGRKVTGELGIMQIIASPHQGNTLNADASTTNVPAAK